MTKQTPLNEVFNDLLSREAMSLLMLQILQERKLAPTAAARIAGYSRATIINKIIDADATVDKSLEIFRALGYELTVSVTHDADNENSPAQIIS